MSDIIVVPTVEQINLEHQLANSKANEAVQHATNCGLMLLQVKASLSHGEWLPWLNGEIESGRLTVGERQARRYMQAASNRTSMSDLKYPAIQEALEIFSDKEPDTEQSALIPVDVEAERQARAKAEAQAEAERQARLTAEQRNAEWAAQNKADRDKLKEAEHQINLLKSAEKPEPKIVEKAPDDYEQFKQKASAFQSQTESLQKQLAALQKQQAKLVNDQVKAKLQEREKELNDMEQKKAVMQEQVDRMKAYMASLDSEAKRLEVHQDVIEKDRLHLIDLAAFLSDIDPISDAGTIKKWKALVGMHRDAANAIESVFSNLPQIKSV